jgi:hypothetical protein
MDTAAPPASPTDKPDLQSPAPSQTEESPEASPPTSEAPASPDSSPEIPGDVGTVSSKCFCGDVATWESFGRLLCERHYREGVDESGDVEPGYEPKFAAGLTAGRVVHYVLPRSGYVGRHDRVAYELRPCEEMRDRPGIIVNTLGNDSASPDPICNLTVFLDGHGDTDAGAAVVWIPGVMYSPDGAEGTWHYPERAE